jgi:hypothetical protein
LAESDGYQIEAYMDWVNVADDMNDVEVPKGTMGACVEAIDGGLSTVSGFPAICHFVTVDANTANRVYTVTLD